MKSFPPRGYRSARVQPHAHNGSRRTTKRELLPSHLPLAARLVPQLRFEIDFIGRIHGHSGSNQARREKTRKAARQVTAPIERNTCGCKGVGRFNEARTNARKDARPVRRRESEDCEGGEKALGEGSGASEESGIVPSRGKPHVPFSHFVENP